MAPTLDETLGAFYIGVIAGAALWGISCMQTYLYYTSYPRDLPQLKVLVFVVWGLDTVHQVLISHAVYIYSVKNFANPAILGEVVWSVLAEVVINALTSLIVQYFFVYRIWRLSNANYLLTVPVAVLSLGQFLGFVVYCVKAYGGHFTTFPQILTLKDLDVALNIITAVTDLAIAAVLTYLLHRSRTGFRRSDSVITKLIVFTVNTGLLTSINAMCSFISYVANPTSFIYICFFFVMGRLYANSLLATLNARNNIREQSRNDSNTLQSIPMDSRAMKADAFHPSAQRPNVAVKVSTMLESDADYSVADEQNSISKTRSLTGAQA